MKNDNLDFFDKEEAKQPSLEYKILPVSVIDIEAQGKRINENHSSLSSRANYSPFPNEVSELCYEFFLRDASIVCDPFAGWGERHSYALKYNKKYYGFDTSQVAIDKALSDYGVTNILADSMSVEMPKFNGMITCPPYWNLEKYASDDGIDRIKTWDVFKTSLMLIFARFYEAADTGSIFCIMVGDWRKNHVYYDLEFAVSAIFKSLGAETVDKICVSRKKISKIKIMLPQAKRLGYSVRVHENLLVFKKP